MQKVLVDYQSRLILFPLSPLNASHLSCSKTHFRLYPFLSLPRRRCISSSFRCPSSHSLPQTLLLQSLLLPTSLPHHLMFLHFVDFSLESSSSAIALSWFDWKPCNSSDSLLFYSNVDYSALSMYSAHVVFFCVVMCCVLCVGLFWLPLIFILVHQSEMQPIVRWLFVKFHDSEDLSNVCKKYEGQDQCPESLTSPQ